MVETCQSSLYEDSSSLSKELQGPFLHTNINQITYAVGEMGLKDRVKGNENQIQSLALESTGSTEKKNVDSFHTLSLLPWSVCCCVWMECWYWLQPLGIFANCFHPKGSREVFCSLNFSEVLGQLKESRRFQVLPHCHNHQHLMLHILWFLKQLNCQCLSSQTVVVINADWDRWWGKHESIFNLFRLTLYNLTRS